MAWTAPTTWTVGQVLTAALMNTHVRDNELYLKGDAAWTAPTLLNSWVNFGAPWNNAEYKKIGDLTIIRGMVKSGTVNATIFTLGAGYRPPAKVRFSTQDGNNVAQDLDIDSSGNVSMSTGASNANTSLACVFSNV